VKQYGMIADRYVHQHHGSGTSNSSGFTGVLEMKSGGDPRDAGPQFLGKPVEVPGSTVCWEKMELSLVERGMDVDELSIDVDEDIGFVEFEVRSEQFRAEHYVANGRVDPELQPLSTLDDPFLLSPSPLLRVHDRSRRPAVRRGLKTLGSLERPFPARKY